jgi:hypothetical protein
MSGKTGTNQIGIFRKKEPPCKNFTGRLKGEEDAENVNVHRMLFSVPEKRRLLLLLQSA